MRKFAILVAGVAALAATAVFAVSASASTVGGAVCELGGDPAVADDGVACEPPSPVTGDFDGFSPSHHCNNLLYVGPGDSVGQRPGNAYYTIGDPFVATDLQHNAAAEGDCDNDVVDGDPNDDDLQAGSNSIVVLRAVGYLNESGQSAPDCNNPLTDPSRNPGCANGEDAGYIAVLGPPGTKTAPPVGPDPSAGAKGEVPIPG